MSSGSWLSVLVPVAICLNAVALWHSLRDRDRRERASGDRPLPYRTTRFATGLHVISGAALLAAGALLLL